MFAAITSEENVLAPRLDPGVKYISLPRQDISSFWKISSHRTHRVYIASGRWCHRMEERAKADLGREAEDGDGGGERRNQSACSPARAAPYSKGNVCI